MSDAGTCCGTARFVQRMHQCSPRASARMNRLFGQAMTVFQIAHAASRVTTAEPAAKPATSVSMRVDKDQLDSVYGGP